MTGAIQLNSRLIVNGDVDMRPTPELGDMISRVKATQIEFISLRIASRIASELGLGQKSMSH